MSDIIALVWDFDKTLVEGYMQDPIFKEYQIDSKEFWSAPMSVWKCWPMTSSLTMKTDSMF